MIYNHKTINENDIWAAYLGRVISDWLAASETKRINLKMFGSSSDLSVFPEDILDTSVPF